uniref:C-type lectin domain-containing protein n=1 Tax=Panagrolaimus superbus TaxID=310955 RepID=A0A914XTR1_9BILA
MFDNIFLSNEAGKIFTNVTNSDFWFGANDLFSQGIWSWMDGAPFHFNDWDNGQPQSSLDNGCGAVLIQGAKWISDNCFKQKPFVCTISALSEIKPTTTLAPSQNLCSEGWTYFNYTGFCYMVLVEEMTWDAAEKACIAEGSHLISIHSWREMIFATDLASPYSSNACDWHAQTWIGFYTKDVWKNYQWSDGTPFDYKSWGPREPNGPEGLNNCGNIWTGVPCIGTDWVPAELYDYWCDNTMETSICKKNS